MLDNSWTRIGPNAPPDQTNAHIGSGRTVVYAPRFVSQEHYNNHYHRAAWYLPRLDNVLELVIFGVEAAFSRSQKPKYFCGSSASTNHIVDVVDAAEYGAALDNADLILVWAPLPIGLLETFERLGKRVINIATDDCSAAEYGQYSRIHWALMPRDLRRRYLSESFARFRTLAEEVWAAGLKSAVVFGTGPSIDRAFEFDFSSCYTHVCNSIVGNQDLLDHINPWMVSAGDAVSHLGVSLYAHKFREDLVRYIVSSRAYFLTTAGSGLLFTLQYPQLAPRIILCDQMGATPNFNLLETWALPGLDSVLNIHMLPAASTLFNNVFILGCDGKNPNPDKNEDFWPHSSAAQYHELVETGHQAHPTFDINRQKGTWSRYKTSVRDTLIVGETRYGKRFRTLTPSFTPGLDVRYSQSWDIGPVVRKRTKE